MKLGCSSSSYQAAFRAGRIEQRDWVRLCAEELEVDGVELVDMHFPTTDRAYLRELKKQCVDLQLTIAGIAVNNDFGDEDRRSQEIASVRQWCDIAAYIGAPVVRVFAGTAPAAVPSPEVDPGRIMGAFRKVFGTAQPNMRRAWSDAASALRECADYAEERGVVLALQNTRDGLVPSQAELAQCVRDVGSPWLRICLDPGDLVQSGGFDASLRGIVQVHARMHDVRDDGSDASTPWQEVVRQLRSAQYRGFLLVDYQGAEEPEQAVPRAVRHLRGVMQMVQTQRVLSPPADLNGAADAAPIEGTAEITPREASEPR
jgi:sugar phosphate isomerase/epimerase